MILLAYIGFLQVLFYFSEMLLFMLSVYTLLSILTLGMKKLKDLKYCLYKNLTFTYKTNLNLKEKRTKNVIKQIRIPLTFLILRILE